MNTTTAIASQAIIDDGTTASASSCCNAPIHLCLRCNASFTPRSSWQKFCSGRCRTAACRAASNEAPALVSVRLRQQKVEIEQPQTKARVALRRATKLERDAIKSAKALNHKTFLATARELRKKNRELTGALTANIKTSDAEILNEFKTLAEVQYDTGVLGVAIALRDKQDLPPKHDTRI